jgi:hypothetical protein
VPSLSGLFNVINGLKWSSSKPHSSIRNWSCKHGYNRLLETPKQGGECAIFVDESILFGSEKILLILGISKDKIPLDRAVSHTDMDVLYVGYSNEWKAESIADEL